MDVEEQHIVNLIANDDWMVHVLRTVQLLELPDWCICAGFVRTKVWDYLHEFVRSTRLPDVDIVYFDTNHIDESTEKEYEKILGRLDASIPWSVKNQARMHVKNGHAPYVSTFDGLAHFPEMCTAIGVYLDTNDEICLIAPYGIDDLVNLVVRPTPFYTSKDNKDIYEQRLEKKKWHLTWYGLKIAHTK